MREAPYGAWKSPITSDLIVSSTVSLGTIQIDGGDVYWLEGRPQEGGRQVLVRRTPNGETADVTPPPFNVRTRVHEYGGGAYGVSNGVVVFANFADQRLYILEPEREARPLSQVDGMRYADFIFDQNRARLIGVREDHSGPGEAVNTIAAISLDSGEEQVLISGHDFFSTPRLSPDGRRLCWLAWDHPNMPWDETKLWVANLDDSGAIVGPRRVPGNASFFQPEWGPDGSLFFVSDRSGWWNLYRANQEKGVEAVVEMEAEFGLPQWVFDTRTYAILSDGRLLAGYSQGGRSRLALIDPAGHQLMPLDLPLTSFGGLRASGVDPAQAGTPELGAAGVGERPLAYFVGASATIPAALYELDLDTNALQSLAWSTDLRIDEGYISGPEPVEFPTEGGLTAHALFYRPKNKDFSAPAGEAPPLIVMSHGGPTSASGGSLSLGRQYWTSRGFAVLDVNYGGSTGYGRAYRERLKGKWGIVDVDDCANGARYLAERGLVDGERMAITGGSAGGYTTLAALTFRDVFKAGASHYGIGDLEALARDTHKFESRYLDGLIGPYPERIDLYHERSPIHHVERLSRPAIFFQGLEDEIVPPNQAEAMVDALRRKGVPVAYLAFEGEQHGFRKAENIKRSLDAELYFYSRIFGFQSADEIEPVEIENLA
jgi:dipeptidyl aminopeptidase/acylaminoacyl peptidase